MVRRAAPDTPYAVVLAVKRLADAKSRLTPMPGDDVDRADLVIAMLADTLAAVAAAGPAETIVVSPDPRVQALGTARGVRVVDEPDRPTPGVSALNTALSAGAAAASAPIVVYLQADLPALRAPSLVEAVADGAAALVDAPAAFVADRSGAGTCALIARRGFAPRFGTDSAAAHRAAGAVELDPGRFRWPDLRTDIDTPDDLCDAAGLGFAASTRRLLAGVGLVDRTAEHRCGTMDR